MNAETLCRRANEQEIRGHYSAALQLELAAYMLYRAALSLPPLKKAATATAEGA